VDFCALPYCPTRRSSDLTVLLGLAPAPAAAEATPIGFIGTLSGPGSVVGRDVLDGLVMGAAQYNDRFGGVEVEFHAVDDRMDPEDRKSTRLNSSHVKISY